MLSHTNKLKKEIDELLDADRCEWTWDETRKGYVVKGLKTGKSIFLPAAGYGFEYVASTLDRVRGAALSQDDNMLQMPIVTPVGDEAWSVKESIVSEEDVPEWGDRETRGIMMEVTTAAAVLAGGSNAVILRHPESVKNISALIADLT